MKKKLDKSLKQFYYFIFFLLLFIVAFSGAENREVFAADVWDGTIASNFAGGSGISEDPYQIATSEQLALFADGINNDRIFLDDCFVLTADIELNLPGSYSNKWTPIDRYFGGSLDGNGHTISGIYINREDGIVSEDEYLGLFSEIESYATISNLGIINAYIAADEEDSYSSIGCLAGENGGTITNCYSSGILNGGYWAGGIVGTNHGIVTNSYSGCSITSENKSIGAVGGIAGRNQYADSYISECYYFGTLECNTQSVGGVTGKNQDGRLESCFNLGTVINNYNSFEGESGGSYTGGVVGLNGEFNFLGEGDTVSECYNSGIVKGGSYAGGVVGENNGTVIGCYNSRSDYNYTVQYDFGLIVGWNHGSITGCYNLVDINTGFNFMGVIAGWNDAEISNCFNTGNISSVGGSNSGIANNNSEEGQISNCWNTGSLNGSGIVISNHGTISSCYNTGAITGESGITRENEGLIDNCYNAGEIAYYSTAGIAHTNSGIVRNCYNIGNIAAEYSEYSSGIVVTNSFMDTNGTISNCYYLNESAETGVFEYGDAPSLTYSEMKSEAFVLNLNTTGGTAESSQAWMIDSSRNEGYPILTGITGDENRPEDTAFTKYYGPTETKTFRIIDPSAGYPPATGFELTVGDTTYNTGNSGDISLNIPNDYHGDIIISKDGYYTYTMPNELITNYNFITMIRDIGIGNPFIQSVLIKTSSFAYTNLRLSEGQIFEGSLEKNEIRVDVNWNGNEEGTVWLEQGSKIVPVINGTTGELPLGLHFSENDGSIYVCTESGGKKISTRIRLAVYEEPQELTVDTGDDVDFSIPEDSQILPSQSMKVSIADMFPIELEIKSDGTFQGTLGLNIETENQKSAIFGTIKDAFKSYRNGTYDKDKMFDNTLKQIKGYAYNDVRIKETYSSFGIKVNTEFLGYIEGSVVKRDDGSFGLDIVESGVMTKLSGKANYDTQIMIGPVPAYWKAAIEANVKLHFELGYDSEGNTIIPPLLLNSSLRLSAGFGAGVVGVSTVGVSGGANTHFDGVLPISSSHLEVYEDYYINIFDYDFLGFVNGSAYEIKSDKYYIYKNGEWFPGSEKPLLRILQDTPELKQASRKYLAEPSEFMVNGSVGKNMYSLLTENALDSSIIKTNTYISSAPQLAVISDGTRVLVWVEDDGVDNRPVDSNRTAVYYSVFNPESELWSVPEIVEQDYTADFKPVLKTIEDEVFLVWMDANTVFENSEPDLSSVSAAMDISYAQFDKASDSFTGAMAVSNDSYLSMLADVAVINGQPNVVWVQNTDNDIFGTSGDTSIQCAVYDGDAWSITQMETNLQAVDGLSAANISGELNVFFSQDTDHDMSTADDKEIYYTGSGWLQQLTDNDMADTKPSYENGMLYWYSDLGIGTIDFSSGSEEPEYISLTADASDNYQYIPGTDGTDAIIYNTTDGDGSMSSNLYAIFNNGFGWGKPVQVADSNQYIKSFDAAFLDDRMLVISANVRTINEDNTLGQADLVLYKITPVCDISVSNAMYNPYSLMAGTQLEMSADVKNNGSLTIDIFEIKVFDSEGSLLDMQRMNQTLLPGENATLYFTYTLPKVITDSNLTVQILPAGLTDRDITDNTIDYALKLDDISVEELNAENQGDACFITARIVNRGLTVLTDVGISLYADAFDNVVLETEQIASIVPQGVAVIKIELPKQENGSLLYVTADEQENENVLENNSNLTVVHEMEEVELPIEETIQVTSITTDSLPDGIAGTAYSYTLEATGSTPITWSVDSSGSLPGWLTLSAEGVLSGMPTAAGDYTFTVKAENMIGDDTRSYTITISAPSETPDVPTGIIDKFIIYRNGQKIIVPLDGINGYAFAYSTENELYQYLKGSNEYPVVYGIQSGTKYMLMGGFGGYAMNFSIYPTPLEAMENTDSILANELNAYYVFEGFDSLGNVILTPLTPESFEIVYPISGDDNTYHFKGINIDFNRDIQAPTDWSQIKITDSNGVEIPIGDVRTIISANELQVYSNLLETGNYYTIRIPTNTISDLDGNKYDRDIEIRFKVEYQIVSIEDITDTVSQNESYSLPSAVTGIFNDGTDEYKESYRVVWDSSAVDTSVIGTYTYYGTVNGYSGNVKLTLNVVVSPDFEIEDPITDGCVYNFKGINIRFNRDIQVPTDWSQIKITDSNGVEIPIDDVGTTISTKELQVYSRSMGDGDYTIRIPANTISDIDGSKYAKDIEISFKVECGIASIQDIIVFC
jgi:hypothetical protein